MKDKEKKQKIKEVQKLQEQVEKLQSQVNSLKQEKEELFAKLQRLSADYANFQKRSVKQTAETVACEKEKIIKALLPALDNFEHTLNNSRKTDNLEAVSKGITIVHEQMLDILQSIGVEQINALNQKFDPSEHEAFMRKSDPEKEQDIILEVFQKGYKLNGRVIRPSKVVVNKPETREETQEPAVTDTEKKQKPENDSPNEQQQNNNHAEDKEN